MSSLTEPEGMSATGALPVSMLIADSVVRVSPDASMLRIADVMTTSGVGALVVGGEGRPIGIVSERDLVAALAARRSPDATTAADVATTELVWCDVAATVAEVAEEMCERYVRHVLVEDDGRLVGIVSARDLLGVYAASDVEFDS